VGCRRSKRTEDAFDALVLARRVERAQQIAQLHFLPALVAEHARERAAGGVAAELLDQAALGCDHERRAIRQGLQPAAEEEHRQQEQQQPEEQDVEDEPAGEVHRIPQPDEKPGDGSATTHFVHCIAPGRHDSVTAAAAGFMRRPSWRHRLARR
jgi:hypothetical protein